MSQNATLMRNAHGTAEAEASSMTWLKQIDDHNPQQTDHEYADMPPFVVTLSAYKEATVSYITGYVIQMTMKQVHCSVSY